MPSVVDFRSALEKLVTERPLGPALGGLAAGIAGAEWGDHLYIAIAGLLGIALHLLTRRIWFIVFSIFFACGFLYWDVSHPRPPSKWEEGRYVETSARVLDWPSTRDGRTRFTAAADNGAKLAVTCYFPARVSKGDRVQVNGILRTVKGPRNPGEFDYRSYYAHRGIFFTMGIKERQSLRLSGRAGNGLTGMLNSVITNGRNAIQANMDGRCAALVEGMLFGIQGDISEEDFTNFQKSGLVHLFSVSGFHIGFVILFGTVLARVLCGSRKQELALVSLFILLYGFLSGWPQPLVRAAIMAWLALAAYYLGRSRDLLNALYLAGIIILVKSPGSLFDISFQFSFMATWGIVCFYPLWENRFKPEKPWAKFILLSLAPQIAVLPLAAYYFNLISLISTVANLLLVDLAGGAVILGFIGVLLAQLSPFGAGFFLLPAGLITRLVISGSAFLAGLPGSFLWTAKPGILAVAAGYLGIILVSVENNSHPHVTRAGIIGLLIFVASLLVPGQYRDWGTFKAVFLDVGQGDCAFIKTASGFTILIDGGGSETYPVGKKVVLPYLRRNGFHRIDLAIATHAHTDHLQGLNEVLEECPARAIVCAPGCRFKNLAGQPRITVLRGRNSIKLDEKTTLDMWEPESKNAEDNETSIIARITVQDISFLLTGDAGREELELYLRSPGGSKPVTVLKIPHHGSRSSWSPLFASATRPSCAVISVGVRNIFNHPHPEVLAAWQARRVQLFRTDRDGAVIFTTNGQTLWVQKSISVFHSHPY